MPSDRPRTGPTDGPLDGHGLAALPPPPEALAEGAGLFLDFDGTLVDIAARPDAVSVAPALPGLLAALARRLGGRLAIVSGRSVAEIVAFLGPLEGCAIAGSHGIEMRRADGRLEHPGPPVSLAETVAEVRELADRLPGVMVEPKPFGVALHYRRAPEAAEAVAALAGTIARRGVFSLQFGKMVCELRAAGADKGDAMQALLAEAPMAGSRPVFVGDDLTDEAGFRAAETAGGAGVLVGDEPDGDGGTSARYRLADVAAVHAWLGDIAAGAPHERVPA